MDRVLVFSHLDAYLFDISLNDVIDMTRREEINGEHSLEITTTQILEKNQRLLYEDERGYWREYVVQGVDEAHTAGKRIVGTYYAVWSIQTDLQGVIVSLMPGVQSPVAAGVALTNLLAFQSRWSVGTVTDMATGGASMYDMSAWNAMGVLLENWGGELDVTITVDANSGVALREVDLYAMQGNQTVLRRFDFGSDTDGITRKFSDDPYYCRVSPRGKGEASGDGYGRKITIESVNDDKDWLEYAPMVDVAKIPDGNGGYQYPTVIIENGECETPSDLKTWAQSVIADVLTPKVTYEIDVIQAAIAGVDVHGVSLGDSVHIVDDHFGSEQLRLEKRVTGLVVNELNGREITATIGALDEAFGTRFSTMTAKIDAAQQSTDVLASGLSTADYIDSLVARINAEINATGGYTYIVPGNGILTYDTAVTDPTVGAEASQVVEIKGGSIRIANSKTAQGAWEWKTVFTSGHIASDLITAVQLTAGRIESADGKSYWDLSNNTLKTVNMTAENMTSTGTITSIKTWYISGMRYKRGVTIDDGAVILQGTKYNESTMNDYGTLSSRYHNNGGCELAIQTPGHIIEYPASVVCGIQNNDGTHRYGSEPGGTVVSGSTAVSCRISIPYTYNFSGGGATNGTIILDFINGRCVSVSASGGTVTQH